MGRSGGSYTAPPLVGGYGRGYGGYGYGFPVFAPPIFFFNPLGSIFQLFLLLAAVSEDLNRERERERERDVHCVIFSL